MAKRRKIKVKIKKKNFTIFVVIVILIIYSCVKLTTHLTSILKDNNKPQINEEHNEQINTNKTDKEKYNELENIDKQIEFFNNDYLDRYIDYKSKNKYLPIVQIIKNVNMHMDLKHYEDTEPANKIGTEKILVNKHYYLENNYIPENLQSINKTYALTNMKLVDYAKEAFESLAKEAKKEGYSIIAMSTYRSYSYQVNLYNKYVKSDGKKEADTYSGRPGHSEHQTGLAVDVYNGKETYTNFERTKEFNWMQENAYKYGFILRFPKDKEKETGYQYESWHYRYVGLEIAKYIHENNISFEEYYATKIKDW